MKTRRSLCFAYTASKNHEMEAFAATEQNANTPRQNLVLVKSSRIEGTAAWRCRPSLGSPLLHLRHTRLNVTVAPHGDESPQPRD
jgi:hypothetical protein